MVLYKKNKVCFPEALEGSETNRNQGIAILRQTQQDDSSIGYDVEDHGPVKRNI